MRNDLDGLIQVVAWVAIVLAVISVMSCSWVQPSSKVVADASCDSLRPRWADLRSELYHDREVIRDETALAAFNFDRTWAVICPVPNRHGR